MAGASAAAVAESHSAVLWMTGDRVRKRKKPVAPGLPGLLHPGNPVVGVADRHGDRHQRPTAAGPQRGRAPCGRSAADNLDSVPTGTGLVLPPCLGHWRYRHGYLRAAPPSAGGQPFGALGAGPAGWRLGLSARTRAAAAADGGRMHGRPTPPPSEPDHEGSST